MKVFIMGFKKDTRKVETRFLGVPDSGSNRARTVASYEAPADSMRYILIEKLQFPGTIFLGEVEDYDRLALWYDRNPDWRGPDKILSNMEIPTELGNFFREIDEECR